MSTTFIEDSFGNRKNKGTAPYGCGFVPAEYLHNGDDEYSIRNRQIGKLYPDADRLTVYRPLTQLEIAALEQNQNRAADWNTVFVSKDGFAPALVRGCSFAGLVRIGRVKGGFLRFHDYTLPVGLSNSCVISCDIGDDCAIHDCRYLSHYIIADRVILSSINEMDTTNHAKFGQGVVKEGEDESVRIWIDPVNEAGGRGVLPFRDMIPADAWLWAMYREDAALMDTLKTITQNSVDSRRGYYGVVGAGAVVKHCLIIKDTNIGESAYIKGANKLKNLTIQSNEDSTAQIGEGVELVNGVIGYGSHVFYGCKAVRFVLGNNCSLKYGARLIHSVLGDNSTVSCCEVLNNLVFPFHEQHHNNSFLIASMIMGQSNMAAGATVGSNHNSRGADGEIIAGRGFWAGLSSTLKHNCRFASFTLIAKGNYPAEMNVSLPFTLVSASADGSHRELRPAYWWLYNMYALERNCWKFRDRDTRVYKAQHIETDYLAPDTAAEIFHARELLKNWMDTTADVRADSHADPRLIFAPENTVERRRTVKILHPARSLSAYREMLVYYGVKTLLEFFENADNAGQPIYFAEFQSQHTDPVSLNWVNMGGQLVPEAKFDRLRVNIRNSVLDTWEKIHAEYDCLWQEYPLDKALNALQTLRLLADPQNTGNTPLTLDQWHDFVTESVKIRSYIEDQVYKTRQKDYENPYRSITYRSPAERDAVLGTLDSNSFVKQAQEDTQRFLALSQKFGS